jgi:hypothetical protein
MLRSKFPKDHTGKNPWKKLEGDVSKYYHGSVHDNIILRESGLLEHTQEHVQIIADKSYIGEQYVLTPRKKSRGGELTAEDKDFNQSISSANFEKISKIAHVVTALCNLKLSKHAIRNNRPWYVSCSS